MPGYVNTLAQINPGDAIWVQYTQAAGELNTGCLLYTSDAADDLLCVDLGGRRIIKKKKKRTR